MTQRIYLENPDVLESTVTVVSSRDGWCQLSASVFHPGGGGQPHDRGHVIDVDGVLYGVLNIREDDVGNIWLQLAADLAEGSTIRCCLDGAFRYALMRHHALMHIVNTVAYREYGAMMTGTQLGDVQSRIDFNMEAFTREMLVPFENSVNEVIKSGIPITSKVISEATFLQRPELVRTLKVAPPVVDGTVRIVEIGTYDAQACGGTHVHSTSEIGVASLVKFENKGKQNKRFYWRLEP